MLFSLRHALAAVLLAALPSAMAAQGAAITFGAMQRDAGAPVEITSDNLELDREAGRVEFTGEVLLVQGEVRLSAERLLALYGGEDGRRDRLEEVLAEGGVVFVSGEGGAAAEADSAVYTLATGVVVMTGNVLLVEEGSTLAGDRLTLDLPTGSGRMEGRVRTLLPGAAE
ncbi:MAG: lipopolysaccharide transport periplasmic protein LptA [Rhodobacteraceae bacterium]|nr:lipopolysaccharide transport periplasmic protein LptA [Paracoccaceae bacterium]